MSSRKRYLLAFLLALLPTLLLLIWVAGKLNMTHRPPSPVRQVPIQLSELAFLPPVRPAPKSSHPASRTTPTVKPASPLSRQAPPPAHPPMPQPDKPVPKKPISRPAKARADRATLPPDHPTRSKAESSLPRHTVQHVTKRHAKPRPQPVPRTVRPKTHTSARSPEKPVTIEQQTQPPQTQQTVSLPELSASKTISPPAPPPWLDSKRNYLERLRQHLAQLARDSYPWRARRLGLEGTVHLHFTIHPDGRIDHLRIEKSSGQPVLDDAALMLIEDEMNNRFEPFPADLPSRPISLSLPIQYRLQ